MAEQILGGYRALVWVDGAPIGMVDEVSITVQYQTDTSHPIGQYHPDHHMITGIVPRGELSIEEKLGRTLQEMGLIPDITSNAATDDWEGFTLHIQDRKTGRVMWKVNKVILTENSESFVQPRKTETRCSWTGVLPTQEDQN